MALAIAAGVAFATVLTLVLIPSLLVVLNDTRRFAVRMRTGVWPGRESVEPATGRYGDMAGETGEAAGHPPTAAVN